MTVTKLAEEIEGTSHSWIKAFPVFSIHSVADFRYSEDMQKYQGRCREPAIFIDSDPVRAAIIEAVLQPRPCSDSIVAYTN